MKLLALDSPELIRLVAGWMSRKENYEWLDFGNGKQVLTPEWLKIATQRDTELLRVFTADDDSAPVGIVGLTNIDRVFRTARIWVVVGDKSFGARGHATRAASRLLSYAFGELGLHAVNTWIVEHNPSRRIAERDVDPELPLEPGEELDEGHRVQRPRFKQIGVGRRDVQVQTLREQPRDPRLQGVVPRHLRSPGARSRAGRTTDDRRGAR